MLSIAVDVQGPEVVRPYTDKYHVTFPVAVDTADLFGQAFGLKAIPVTYLIDEIGIIRLQGGGPSTKLLRQVEELLAEPLVSIPSHPTALATTRTVEELEAAVQQDSANARLRLALGQRYAAVGRLPEAQEQLEQAAGLKPDDSGVFLAWGMVLLQSGERQPGLLKLKQARDLDPDNWRIRKQIWAVEHPDKFYTEQSPDYGWQREQLKRERSQ